MPLKKKYLNVCGLILCLQVTLTSVRHLFIQEQKYGSILWTTFFFSNKCSRFSASHHGAFCHTPCFLKDYTLSSPSKPLHIHIYFRFCMQYCSHVRSYVCVVGKSSTDPIQISKALLLTVLLTRILLQCLPDEAGACCISITFDRRESPALAKRNKYRMLMARNVHRAENNIFDKMLSVLCLSQTLAGCDSYFCPSLTWVMELSFLLQFFARNNYRFL